MPHLRHGAGAASAAGPGRRKREPPAPCPAALQDRDDALPLLAQVRKLFPFLELIWAYAGYRCEALATCFQKIGPWRLEIVDCAAGAKRFEVLPRRWVVERTFAWFGRGSRLANDFEAMVETSCAWLGIAMIQLLVRLLAMP